MLVASIKGKHTSPKTEFKEGTKHPNWNGGSSFEPYDKSFNNKFKRAIRKRDNQICILCGIHREKLNKTLDVHHINYNKLLSIPQNCSARNIEILWKKERTRNKNRNI